MKLENRMRFTGTNAKAHHQSEPWRAVCLLLLGLTMGNPNTAPAQVSYQKVKGFVGLGSNPKMLIEGSDHKLYGALQDGGAKWEGVIFRLNKDGSEYGVVHSFTGYMNGEDGSWPQGIVEGKDGVLYGTTQTGGRPFGILYSTGSGTIFKVGRDGSGYSVLHRFPSMKGDGMAPWAGVVEGHDGALYGTTLEGGTNNLGTTFRISKDGSAYTILHHFLGSETDGCRPMSGLLVGSDGWLYGTTDAGGSAAGHNGTVFRISSDGRTYRTLHSFPETPIDGRFPRSGLIEGLDGALYGTTQNGGTNDAGTVFTLRKDGTGYRVLHSFTGSTGTKPDTEGIMDGMLNGVPTRFSSEGEGSIPNGLVQSADGTLYGSTQNGGRNGGGTAFKLNPDGTEFGLVHNFPGDQADGKNPCANMVRDSDSAFYGMTKEAHTNNFALLFRLTSATLQSTPAPSK